MAVQTAYSPGIDGYVSLVPLNSHAIGYSTTPTILQSHQHAGQIVIQTNENNQPLLAYSTSESEQQIQPVENQQQTLLLVTTNPDEIVSGQYTLNQDLIKSTPQVQMQQQIVLLTDMQGSSQGAIIQMPSTASVIQVPGLISTGDPTVTYIGTNQPSPVAVDSSNTVYVANGGDIILCLQPGEITTLEVPSNLIVDGTNTCFTTATIQPQAEEVNQSDLARSWQADSDLVNRALNALSGHGTSVQNSITNVNLVDSTLSPMMHLCPHVLSPH